VLQTLFNPRHPSLLRGCLLVALSFAVSLVMADFPANRANPFLFVPFFLAAVGTIDTARNMRRRWSWYHGGVVLCVYADLMVLSMIAFFWLYPYAAWLSNTH
jgi:tryptophan-rich sensory protein